MQAGGGGEMKKVLHLVLTYHWFDEIVADRKRIEYRDITEFWAKRIWYVRDEITHVRFSRGYTSQTIEFPVSGITIGTCPYPEWDGLYYMIHFDKLVEVER